MRFPVVSRMNPFALLRPSHAALTSSNPDDQCPRRWRCPGATPAAYAADWALFGTWCEAVDLTALPAAYGTVTQFTAENRAAASTTQRRLLAIELEHHRAGLPCPVPTGPPDRGRRRSR